MTSLTQPNIVVIGGGTGSFTVLSGLRDQAVNVTAIVNMSDDGGSTGILRDELGALPPGDIRQCLVALSDSGPILRDLFNYRFEEGSLTGHPFGNLFLTALEKTTGSFTQAVRTASEVLNIRGRVLPVTLTDTQLVLKHPNGSRTIGQYAVQTSRFKPGPPQLSLKPPAPINPEAQAAIAAANLVVIAPGNLYASLAPTLLVDGVGEALRSTPAKIAYVTNLVTKPGQTDNFQVHDFAAEIERFIGAPALDYVLYNTRQPSQQLLDKYAHAGEYPVTFDPSPAPTHYQAIGTDLISDTIPNLKPADQLIPRTLIRHDSVKLAHLIIDFLK